MRKSLFFAIVVLFSCFDLVGQDTYKIGNTTYVHGEYYKTTGKPKVERSETVKREFLKLHGYDKVPYGMVVDHVKPLSQGGVDEVWNMQLISVEAHKRKTAAERVKVSGSNYSSYRYRPSSTNGGRAAHLRLSQNSYNNYSSQSRSFGTPSSNYRNITKSTSRVSSNSKTWNSNSYPSYSRTNYSSSPKYSNNYSGTSYSRSQATYTGAKGGRYYINSNGNKTYLRKN